MKRFTRMMIAAGAFLLLAALLSFVTGCGSKSAEDPAFPDFVYRSEQSLQGYRIAAANRELLRYMPCYCGCSRDAEKYRNLEDCFFDRRTGGYDEHAAGCTTCLDEAIDIAAWKDQGMSAREIREKIDAKYAERGEPTETPMPAE